MTQRGLRRVPIHRYGDNAVDYYLASDVDALLERVRAEIEGVRDFLADTGYFNRARDLDAALRELEPCAPKGKRA